MKILLVSLLLMSTMASADEMTPTGCNALSKSAERAADRFDELLPQLEGEAFRSSIDYMPGSSKTAAANVSATQSAVSATIRDYTRALRKFSEAIKDCGD
ncbi:hypothetical protein [Mesorhizobium sp.]|uniref:hypothetical protein n=1 Tax=Mesorhizobium sp. TaxID=1871066 RepID=UPI000FE973A3|nr:hypothetical protein [Mesorhizobium sp.]RWO23379.1 MAG: hypothetical protein EOS09_17290 [Mesorhizobium sp.]